jgi:hypothetical protein
MLSMILHILWSQADAHRMSGFYAIFTWSPQNVKLGFHCYYNQRMLVYVRLKVLMVADKVFLTGTLEDGGSRSLKNSGM